MPLAKSITVPCSPEQEDILADHLLFNQELGILPDEKAWILSSVRKHYPNAKILNAELQLDEGVWLVSFT
jgi:hypothetical protein